MSQDLPKPPARQREQVAVRVTVRCRLSEGWGGERWIVLSVIDEGTGHDLGDVGISSFDAYSDFPGHLADAVREAYYSGALVDTDKLHGLEVTDLGDGSEIGSSVRCFRGGHPCTE